MPLIRWRQEVWKFFCDFPRVAIIGGMVRDLARQGKGGFRSDIDLVVDAPVDDVSCLAHELSAIPNRYGGFGYRHPNWKVDFWALESTWAFVNGHVKISRIEDLLGCTFFDCDAVLYDFHERAIICDDDYLDKLRSGIIDVKLRQTPSLEGNLLRAVRRLLLWDCRPGPELARLILENLDDERFQKLKMKEEFEYTNKILLHFKNSNHLIDCLLKREERSKLSPYFAKQLMLPGI